MAEAAEAFAAALAHKKKKKGRTMTLAEMKKLTLSAPKTDSTAEEVASGKSEGAGSGLKVAVPVAGESEIPSPMVSPTMSRERFLAIQERKKRQDRMTATLSKALHGTATALENAKMRGDGSAKLDEIKQRIGLGPGAFRPRSMSLSVTDATGTGTGAVDGIAAGLLPPPANRAATGQSPETGEASDFVSPLPALVQPRSRAPRLSIPAPSPSALGKSPGLSSIASESDASVSSLLGTSPGPSPSPSPSWSEAQAEIAKLHSQLAKAISQIKEREEDARAAAQLGYVMAEKNEALEKTITEMADALKEQAEETVAQELRAEQYKARLERLTAKHDALVEEAVKTALQEHADAEEGTRSDIHDLLRSELQGTDLGYTGDLARDVHAFRRIVNRDRKKQQVAIASLEDQLHNLQAEHALVEKELRSAQAELQQQREYRREADRKVEELRSQLTECEIESMATVRYRVSEVERLRDVVETRLAQELEHAREAKHEAEVAVTQLHQQVNQQEHKAIRLEAVVQQKEAEIKALLEGRTVGQEEQLDELGKRIGEVGAMGHCGVRARAPCLLVALALAALLCLKRETRLSEVSGEVSRAEQTLADLGQRALQLQRQLDDAQQAHAALATEASALSVRRKEAEEAVAQLRDEERALHRRVAEVKCELEAREAERRATQEAHEQERRELSATRLQMDEIAKQLDAARAREGERKARLGGKQAEPKAESASEQESGRALSPAPPGGEGALARYRSEVAAAQREVDGARQREEEVLQSLRALEAARDEAQGQVRAQEETLAAITARMQTLRGEVVSLESQRDALVASVREAQEQVQAARREAQELEAAPKANGQWGVPVPTVSALAASEAEAEAVERLRREGAECKLSLESVTKELERARKETAEAQDTLSELTAQVQRISSEVRALRSRRAELQGEVEAAERQLEAKRGEAQDLQKQLQTRPPAAGKPAAAAVAAAVAVSQEEVERKQALAAALAELERARSATAEEQQTLAKLSAQVEVMAAELRLLEEKREELGEVDKALSARRGQVEELDAVIEMRQKALASAQQAEQCSELEEQRRSLSRLRAELERLGAQAAEEEQTLEELKARTEEKRREMSELERLHVELVSSVERLERVLEGKRAESSALSSRVASGPSLLSFPSEAELKGLPRVSSESAMEGVAAPDSRKTSSVTAQAFLLLADNPSPAPARVDLSGDTRRRPPASFQSRLDEVVEHPLALCQEDAIDTSSSSLDVTPRQQRHRQQGAGNWSLITPRFKIKRVELPRLRRVLNLLQRQWTLALKMFDSSPATEREPWLPDEASNVCLMCQTAFSLFTRRHHCRICGALYCASCSARRVSVPKLGITDERVCNLCYGLTQVMREPAPDARLPVLAGPPHHHHIDISEGPAAADVFLQSPKPQTAIAAPRDRACE